MQFGNDFPADRNNRPVLLHAVRAISACQGKLRSRLRQTLVALEDWRTPSSLTFLTPHPAHPGLQVYTNVWLWRPVAMACR